MHLSNARRPKIVSFLVDAETDFEHLVKNSSLTYAKLLKPYKFNFANYLTCSLGIFMHII